MRLLGAYPIAFFDALYLGRVELPPGSLPWTWGSARRHWYTFVATVRESDRSDLHPFLRHRRWYIERSWDGWITIEGRLSAQGTIEELLPALESAITAG